MKKILIIAVVIIIIGGAYYYFKQPKSEQSVVPEVKTQPTSTGETNTMTTGVQNNITIENFSFNPPILKIKAGEKVTWKHNDAVSHSVVSGNLFASDVLSRGGEFSYVFQTVGEYDYHCGIHPSMKGKIIVE